MLLPRFLRRGLRRAVEEHRSVSKNDNLLLNVHLTGDGAVVKVKTLGKSRIDLNSLQAFHC